MASACSVAVATDSKLIGTDFLRTPAATTCVLVTISLVCTCFLVVCGVLVVREYSLGMSYEATRCRLKNVSYSRDINCKFCTSHKDKSKEKGASACVESQFPCVRLTVTYPSSDGSSICEAMFHTDSLQASGPYNQCSYSICLKTREENDEAVNKYAEEWMSNKDEFPCYYNTEQPGSVIAHKMYSQSDVIHAMLWPSLIVLACGIIFLRLEMRRRKLTWCGRVGGRDRVAGKGTDGLDESRFVVEAERSGLNSTPRLPHVQAGTTGDYGKLEGETRHQHHHQKPELNKDSQYQQHRHHDHHHHHHFQPHSAQARKPLPGDRRFLHKEDQQRLLKTDQRKGGKGGGPGKVKNSGGRLAIMKDGSLEEPHVFNGAEACREIFYSSLPVLDKIDCTGVDSGSDVKLTIETDANYGVADDSVITEKSERPDLVKICASAEELLTVTS